VNRADAIKQLPNRLRDHFEGNKLSEVELGNELILWAMDHHPDDKVSGVATRMMGIIRSGGIPNKDGLFLSPPPPKPRERNELKIPNSSKTLRHEIVKGYEFDRVRAETEFLQKFRECVGVGDIQAIYQAVFKSAVERGSHHHMKLLMEYLMGKPAELQQTQHVNVNRLIEQMAEQQQGQDDETEFDFDIDGEVEIYGLPLTDDYGSLDSEVWPEAGMVDGSVSPPDLES
jgi:hypothetical protein